MRGPFFTIATFALQFALARCSTGILLHPQAPQEQAGEEHDDRDQRHLRDCVHSLVSLSRTNI
jgi:hypothetical protein